MDYGAIVKEAWRVTWRYKILWLFGLLAGGGMSYSSNGSSGYSGSGSDFGSGSGSMPSEFTDAADSALQWMQNNLALIIALAIVAVIIALALFIISVAARGGLIRLVNDAEEGREVRAGNGWSAGFGAWGRLFLVRLVLYLPFALLLGALIVVTVLPVALANMGEDAAFVPALLGTCGLIAVLGILGLIVGFVVMLVDEFSERHIVLDDRATFESLSAGWADFKTHFKEALLMWLITIVISIVFGVIMFIALMIIGVSSVLAFLVGGICGGALAALALLALFLVPAAIYSTFLSAVWTLFWRAIHGRPMPLQAQTYVAPAPSATPPTPPASAP